MPKELSTNSPSDRTFLDHWTDWLATEAPRRLAPATVVGYKRQVVAFAGWAVSFAPESITSYRIEQNVATLELQVTRKIRKPATFNKAVAALSSIVGADRFGDPFPKLCSWDDYHARIDDYGQQLHIPVTPDVFVDRMQRWFITIAESTDQAFPSNTQVKIVRGMYSGPFVANPSK